MPTVHTLIDRLCTEYQQRSIPLQCSVLLSANGGLASARLCCCWVPVVVVAMSRAVVLVRDAMLLGWSRCFYQVHCIGDLHMIVLRHEVHGALHLMVLLGPICTSSLAVLT